MGQTREVRRQAGEVRVAITAAALSEDVLTTELRLVSGDWPFDPVAPATIWTDDDQPVVELHKLLRLGGDTATFESIANSAPKAGGPYRMFSWWNPTQFRAATDPDVEWSRGTYDKDDHTHCLLTWNTIDYGEVAYQAGPGAGWITVDSYEQYIRDDILRLRHADDR
jgi:hypothetical protein